MVEKTPVKVIQVNYHCDECPDGSMLPTGITLTSYPPQYPHKCTNCGATKTFNTIYPYLEYIPET